MAQVQRMSKLVNRFFQNPLSQQRIIVWQAIEFLAQSIGRHDRAGATHLRLAEYIFENRDIKINLGHPKNPPILRLHQSLHALQDLRRMKLLALGMIRGRRIERHRQYFATDRKPLRNRSAELLQ